MREAARDFSYREQRLISELNATRDQFEGEISIGLPPNRSTAFVNEFFPLFFQIYPKMSLKLDERTSPNLEMAIRHNEIDRFIAVQDPGGTGAFAVEDDLAAADGLLPFGAGTVGEAGGQPGVEPAALAFGTGRAADDAFFLRDHKR